MYKILVADDEPDIVKMLEVFLTKVGFLVVMDIKMPEVSGMNILQEMWMSGKKTPAVILTGMMDAQIYSDDLKSMGYVLEDVVYKPVELSVLLKTIKRKLGIEGEIAG